MFRIAICDDSERDLRLNLDMVNKWKDDNSDSEIVVDVFHSPNDLLESHTEDMYHLWILDIVMPEQDGISLAREIRKKGDETMVIYTSSSTEYAMDAFGIHALGYLPKPVEYTELKKGAVQSVMTVCHQDCIAPVFYLRKNIIFLPSSHAQP